jgi:hypothetical protein
MEASSSSLLEEIIGDQRASRVQSESLIGPSVTNLVLTSALAKKHHYQVSSDISLLSLLTYTIATLTHGLQS